MAAIHDWLLAVCRADAEGREAPKAPAGHETPAGAFVRVRFEGRLLGFAGRVAPAPTFAEAAARALRDALADPRFDRPDVRQTPIEIEVLRLGAARPIDGPGDLVAGTDGVMIRRGVYRAVHVPGGPDDDDARIFLESACIGAGLSPDAWSDPEVEVQGFEVTPIAP